MVGPLEWIPFNSDDGAFPRETPIRLLVGRSDVSAETLA
jgi:hypothetical protein